MATSTAKYKPYPAYKPSSVDWLGEVPAHWGITKLAWITECLDGQRIPLNAEQRAGMQGDIPYWGANSIVDHIDRWLFDEKLVLLGEDGAPFFDRNREVAFTVNGKVWVNNHTHVLRPGPQVLAPFLSSVLNGVDYAAFIDGTTRDKLTQGDMNVIPVQLPPLDEQRAIAAFLDRETAKINSLIAKKERLVELLQEKRTALISRAVTKGLDPDVPMEDSDFEWLGEIPAHWEVKRMKHLAGKIGSGKTPKGGAEVYVDEGTMLIRSQNVHFGGLRLSDVVYIDSATDAEMAGSRVKEGDVLLNITGASLGRCCPAYLDGSNANVNQHVCIVRLEQQRDNPSFLAYSVESDSVQNQIFNNENGVSRDALNFEQIGDLVLARPPMVDQRAIVCHLDRELAKLDTLIARVQDAIKHLKELRAALISAAVTGSIDVREEAA